jgi:MSHA biogenesis protein MshM
VYYVHFGLKQPPFKITPNTEFFFSGGNRGSILDALIYAINSGEGIIKVVGEVGSGKTMLCRMLQTLLSEKVESVYLANPSVAPEDVLHAIAFELQLALPDNADRLQVMHKLQEYLLERHAAGKQVVIFVEEAQGMPLATLEEIRLLSNLETKHDKLLQIVLFGQPELDVNLNETQIRQLRERITHSFSLGPLREEEIGEYLIFRLRAAGYFGPHLFTKASIRLIAKATQGLVRRVNILADKALLAAFAENLYQVMPKHVRAAIGDSEFGAEKVSRAAGRQLYVAIAATLVAGLALGYLVHHWQQLAARPAETKLVAAQAAPVELQPALMVQDTASAIGTTLQATPQADAEEPSTVDAGDILQQRLDATERWLVRQGDSTFSIQLMGAGNENGLRKQLKHLATQVAYDDIYVYRTEVAGKPYISVLYGSYADRKAAVEALQGLPKELLSYGPQLRTVGGINQETKQLQ